ncbi:MAG TPA: sugar transferase [Anaeromyxobacteraceae bacterium]|nr:sugar transferase [Anaeromyxobacteraceae bacterium]
MRNRVIEGTVRLLDILCIVVAVPGAYVLRNVLPVHVRGPLVPLDEYWPFLAFTLLLWIAATWFFRVYESFRTRSLLPEISRIAKALMGVAVVHIAAIFFFRLHEDVSRLFFGTYFVLAFALLAGGRLVLRQFAHSARRNGLNTKVFAVVGSGDLAHDVVYTIEQHPEWGMQFAGHILDAAGAGNPRPRPEHVLGTLSQLGQILDDNVIDEVIFAVPRERLAHVEGAFKLCQEQGASARVCLDLFDVGGARVALGEMDGLPMLAFNRAPTDEVALLLKRAFDVVSSALALLLLSPVLLGTAIAVKLDSPGPVFFRQTRVGKNGRHFKMLKFRSMHVDAEARLESLKALNEASGPVFKMKNDPRVTRVGRFIRRASLDELPQFLNVLSGEMSIVGPRPPVPKEVREYQRWQRRRLSVKPGITCTWQVSGRSNISFDQWMRLDLEYIDTWSLWNDIQICFRTIPAVLTSRGAH